MLRHSVVLAAKSRKIPRKVGINSTYGHYFMTPEKSYIFVSYAKEDLERVRPIIKEVTNELERRAIPVELWMDMSRLQPGEHWQSAIEEALQSSIGFLFFISPGSLESDWVRRELSIASSSPSGLIIPVLLDKTLNLPGALAHRPFADLSGHRTTEEIRVAARGIAKATQKFLTATPQPGAAVSEEEVPLLAADIAQQLRAPAEPEMVQTPPMSVFVVHGHNTESLAKLEKYLSDVGITAVVLSRRDESPQSLFQKFMSVATQARFAIVLLSADDYGASRRQYEAVNVSDKALQFRARQNVILELGFFYGRLGWENVFVLYQEPERVFPNFERPSDLDGVVFNSFSELVWQKGLGAKLSAAGFRLTSSA